MILCYMFFYSCCEVKFMVNFSGVFLKEVFIFRKIRISLHFFFYYGNIEFVSVGEEEFIDLLSSDDHKLLINIFVGLEYLMKAMNNFYIIRTPWFVSSKDNVFSFRESSPYGVKGFASHKYRLTCGKFFKMLQIFWIIPRKCIILSNHII